MDGAAWREQANCRGEPTEAFYGMEGRKRALELCAQCPVASACLAYALNSEEQLGQRYGIWAGTTPQHRRKLARVLKRHPSRPGMKS